MSPGNPSPRPVIPAQAGIQLLLLSLDSLPRGDDDNDIRNADLSHGVLNGSLSSFFGGFPGTSGVSFFSVSSSV